MKMVYNVLVVDDSEPNIILLKDILESDSKINKSTKVIYKSNYRDALSEFDQNEFDLVISDLYFMNNPKGFEICNKAKEENTDTYTILITSKERENINPDKVTNNINKVCERKDDDYADKLVSAIHDFFNSKTTEETEVNENVILKRLKRIEWISKIFKGW